MFESFLTAEKSFGFKTQKSPCIPSVEFVKPFVVVISYLNVLLISCFALKALFLCLLLIIFSPHLVSVSYQCICLILLSTFFVHIYSLLFSMSDPFQCWFFPQPASFKTKSDHFILFISWILRTKDIFFTNILLTCLFIKSCCEGLKLYPYIYMYR